jgi:hypothetical protein
MLNSIFVHRLTAIVTAVTGGYGVFYVIDSFRSPASGARAVILLVGACALTYFGERS